MGTHPLAGHYSSKTAFIEGTFAKLGRVLPQGAQLRLHASQYAMKLIFVNACLHEDLCK
jgi:hypothetical protein